MARDRQPGYALGERVEFFDRQRLARQGGFAGIHIFGGDQPRVSRNQVPGGQADNVPGNQQLIVDLLEASLPAYRGSRPDQGRQLLGRARRAEFLGERNDDTDGYYRCDDENGLDILVRDAGKGPQEKQYQNKWVGEARQQLNIPSRRLDANCQIFAVMLKPRLRFGFGQTLRAGVPFFQNIFLQRDGCLNEAVRDFLRQIVFALRYTCHCQILLSQVISKGIPTVSIRSEHQHKKLPLYPEGAGTVYRCRSNHIRILK